MPLTSLFKRKAKAAPLPVEPPGDESVAVQQARLRARRRLIGAALLLAVGVVVFPLFFETQPRPLPADIPVEPPRTVAVRPVSPPPVARPPSPAVTELPAAPPQLPPSAATAPAAPPASEPPAAAPGPKPEPKPEPRPEPRREAKVEPKPEPKPEAKSSGRPAEAADPIAAIAAAVAGSQSASTPREPRFVVQVGAYTDANTLREVRAKVEKLGLKTFTQTIDTDAGKRTRVRVGPYPTRQEAEGASAKLKGAGLPGNVLVL